MDRDPRLTLSQAPMSRAQIVAVAVTVALNALDGFDVLAISFASPGIAAEWGIDRAALGLVLSMELIGMGVGSILLGSVADRIGRRPTILACLGILTIGMFMAAAAADVVTLSAWRVFTGLGIGGMLAATNAAVAEFSNARNRNFSVALMVIGYPIGAVLGGLVAAELLHGGSWRSIFHFGAIVSAALIPVVWLLLPETVPFLCQRQPRHALDRINRLLKRMGHTAVAVLPPVQAVSKAPLAGLFHPTLRRTTLLITGAYFLHIATFYFILKWVPKIVVDMGFAPSAAAGVLVWANIGGAFGGAALGLLARHFPLRRLTIGVLAGSVLLVAWFGRGQSDLATLSLVVALAGIFTNAGVVGLYALFAEVFPTEVRAAGTGFAIGIGRAGAALSPLVAGLLFEAGFGLQGVAILMASGAGIAAVALFFLKPSTKD